VSGRALAHKNRVMRCGCLSGARCRLFAYGQLMPLSRHVSFMRICSFAAYLAYCRIFCIFQQSVHIAIFPHKLACIFDGNFYIICVSVTCLERDADLHMAQLMPVPLTVSCFSKIQIGFTFLIPAYPGCTIKLTCLTTIHKPVISCLIKIENGFTFLVLA